MNTAPPVAQAAMPDVLRLRLEGFVHMLTTIETDLILGRTITPDSWRAAYGRAADYQTVCEARKVLAGVAS